VGTVSDIQIRPTTEYNSAWFSPVSSYINEAMHYHSTTGDDGFKAIASGANGDALLWQWWNTGNVPALAGGRLSDLTLYTLWDNVSNWKPTDGNVAVSGVDETSSAFDGNDFIASVSLWGRRTWRRDNVLNSGIANMRLGLKSANLQPPNNTTYIGNAYIDAIQTVDCFLLRPTSTIHAWQVGDHDSINDPVISGGQATYNNLYCRPVEKTDSLDFLEMGTHDIPAVVGANLTTIRLYSRGGANQNCKVRVNNVWSAEESWDGIDANGWRYKDFIYTDDISSGISNMGFGVQAESLGNGDDGDRVWAVYLQANYATQTLVDVDTVTIELDLQQVSAGQSVSVDAAILEMDLQEITTRTEVFINPLTLEIDGQAISMETLSSVDPLTVEMDLLDVITGKAIPIEEVTVELDPEDLNTANTLSIETVDLEFNLQQLSTETSTLVDPASLEIELIDLSAGRSVALDPFTVDVDLQDVATETVSSIEAVEWDVDLQDLNTQTALLIEAITLETSLQDVTTELSTFLDPIGMEFELIDVIARLHGMIYAAVRCQPALTGNVFHSETIKGKVRIQP
jgi:hypothetical protein